jgi:Mg/Co/Ni transporter MgtE
MTLKPENTIAEAVNRFQEATRQQGKNVFGLMVTDEADKLVGMLSMYLDDALDSALETMRSNRIHQLFVVGAHADRFEGQLNLRPQPVHQPRVRPC